MDVLTLAHIVPCPIFPDDALQFHQFEVNVVNGVITRRWCIGCQNSTFRGASGRGRLNTQSEMNNHAVDAHAQGQETRREKKVKKQAIRVSLALNAMRRRHLDRHHETHEAQHRKSAPCLERT